MKKSVAGLLGIALFCLGVVYGAVTVRDFYESLDEDLDEDLDALYGGDEF